MSDLQTEKLVALVRAGELAVELWRAQEAAANARTAYHSRIRQYERIHCGGARIKFDPANPAHADIIAFTGERYQAAQVAKKRVYSAKQKLQRVCMKVARLSAMAVVKKGAIHE